MSSKGEQNFKKLSQTDNSIIYFWLLLSILTILTVGNLILNLVLIGALRIGHGMQNLEVNREMEMLKFGSVDLDRIYKRDGRFEGFNEQPMAITGDDSAVLINLINRFGHNHNKFSISNHNGTEFKGINLVDMRDPTTHESIFLFNKPKFHLNNSLLNLEARQISSNRITSSVKESLHLQSRKGSVYVKGIEGTYLDGKEMLITGDQNIVLKSTNGTIELNSSSLGGVYIDLKLLKGHDEFADKGLPQYKLCVCMRKGRVFRVQIPKTAMTTRGVCAIGAEQNICGA